MPTYYPEHRKKRRTDSEDFLPQPAKKVVAKW
jgi:hypothetical protein